MKKLAAKVAALLGRLTERLKKYAEPPPASLTTGTEEAAPPDDAGLPDAAEVEMSETKEPQTVTPEWIAFGETVPGSSHDRAGMPNQDAMMWRPEEGPGLPLILAVSDGHGGKKYFRSDRGARLAVETATTFLEGFIRDQEAYLAKTLEEFKAAEGGEGTNSWSNNMSLIKRAAEEFAPPALVKEWAEAVRRDLQSDPILPEELLRLDEKELLSYSRCAGTYQQFLKLAEDPQALRGDKDFLACEATLLQAYGATLLAAAVTENYILYWQLGDGDILNVSSRRKVSAVMPKDERLFANDTTSLCTDKAWRDFRVVLQPLPEEAEARPALIMLTTDGYANSYESAEGFQKVGADLLNMMCEENGLQNVKDSLESLLRETSQRGSGDDITIGLILRRAVLAEKYEPEAEAEEAPAAPDTAPTAESDESPAESAVATPSSPEADGAKLPETVEATASTEPAGLPRGDA